MMRPINLVFIPAVTLVALLAACTGQNGDSSSSDPSSSSSTSSDSSSSVTISSSTPAISSSVMPSEDMASSSISSAASSQAEQGLINTFGVTQFYPLLAANKQWDSQHWASGSERPLADGVGQKDPTDPTGWSQMRGSGSPELTITGDGRMQMRGGQPRIYFNAYPINSADKNAAEHLWTNVEFTGYFRRLANDGESYGGFVVGMRSGPLGHGSSHGSDCDGTTYYSRLRNDGRWQFQKELRHSDTSVVRTFDVWPDDAPIPVNEWIGMKYVAYTDANGHVHLQAWIDFTEGLNGGSWQLLGEYTDTGEWEQDKDWGEVDASGCDYNSDHIIAPGNGVTFIRNTGGSGEYKWISIREIKVP